jgi:hypothetical protein
MNKLVIAILVTVFPLASVAESFNTSFYGNHQITVGIDDFDDSVVRVILELRNEKVDSSKSDQYINEIGYVCSPPTSNREKIHIRSYYKTAHYVFGSEIDNSLGSTRSYNPLKVKFDDEAIITVPLTQKNPDDLWPELELTEPELINKMKSNSAMRIKDGNGGSAKFDLEGVASAFNTFYKYCK